MGNVLRRLGCTLLIGVCTGVYAHDNGQAPREEVFPEAWWGRDFPCARFLPLAAHANESPLYLSSARVVSTDERRTRFGVRLTVNRAVTIHGSRFVDSLDGDLVIFPMRPGTEHGVIFPVHNEVRDDLTAPLGAAIHQLLIRDQTSWPADIKWKTPKAWTTLQVESISLRPAWPDEFPLKARGQVLFHGGLVAAVYVVGRPNHQPGVRVHFSQRMSPDSATFVDLLTFTDPKVEYHVITLVKDVYHRLMESQLTPNQGLQFKTADGDRILSNYTEWEMPPPIVRPRLKRAE